MTPEEARQKLQELGIPEGQWIRSKPVDPKTLPTVQTLKETLEGLARALESQIQADQKTMAGYRTCLEGVQKEQHGKSA